MSDSSKEIWAISDGRAGMRNQALGLAEKVAAASGLTVVEKTITPTASWKWLPVRWRPFKLAALGTPPALAIGCGRAAIAPLLAMKRHGWPTRTAYVQDPRIDPTLFDLVVPPAHDRLSGPNVLATQGAMHRISPARLEAEAAPFAEKLSALPRPHIAVLIGGRSAAFDFTAETARQLVDDLLALPRGSLLITASRRTGHEAAGILLGALSGQSDVWFFDGANGNQGANPYFAFLHSADHILVTEDSANMVTEAVSTGKPVYILPQPLRSARRAAKFRSFHQALYEAGRAQPFTGVLNGTANAPFDNAAEVTAALVDMLPKA